MEAALNHREPDRVPLDMNITLNAYLRVRDYLGLPPEPDVAYDRFGGRTGHGGGHIDRMLAGGGARLLKVGLGFDFQVFDRVPMGKTDVRLDVIVTETETMRCT